MMSKENNEKRKYSEPAIAFLTVEAGDIMSFSPLTPDRITSMGLEDISYAIGAWWE